jgi:hypothetical protein
MMAESAGTTVADFLFSTATFQQPFIAVGIPCFLLAPGGCDQTLYDLIRQKVDVSTCGYEKFPFQDVIFPIKKIVLDEE